MYNLEVEGNHDFFVGEKGWLVHNCPTARPVVYTVNGVERSYVSYLDVQLPNNLFVAPRGVHFANANEELYNALMRDSSLKTFFQQNYPGVFDFVKPSASGTFSSRSPTQFGFTWHHSISAQANGSEGVMQLVRNTDHVAGSRFYHPGSSGGCAEWGGGCR